MDNSRIKIIANPEGFNINELFKIEQEKTNEKRIICGNLIDSCSESGCEFIEKKKFNIRNIEKCINDEDYSLIFGPRDLNKIKIIPLTILNLSQNAKINTFITNYNNNVNDFKYPTNDELQGLSFQVENIDDYFFSFWNRYNRGADIGKKLDTLIDASSKHKIIFLKRFIEIFYDIDALNLIVTIPLEIFDEYKLNNLNDEIINIDKLKESYKAFMNFIHKNGKLTIEQLESLDKLAYYTIVAFRKMLNGVVIQQGKIDGLLFNLYINNKNNLIQTFYAQGSKQVITILSYGGVNRKLAKHGVKILKNFYYNLQNLNKIFEVINSAKEYKPNYLLQNQSSYETYVNQQNKDMYDITFKQHTEVNNIKDTGEEYKKTYISKKKGKNKALYGGFIYNSRPNIDAARYASRRDFNKAIIKKTSREIDKIKELSVNLEKTCSEINTFFKEILNKFLNNNAIDNNNLKSYRPGPALTFLMAMTEYFDCNQDNFVTKENICKNAVIGKGLIFGRHTDWDKFSTDMISPLVSDYIN
jgi:hypothetical protein